MQSQSGSFNSGDVLNISNFYEMSIFTNDSINVPLPKIMCSNDGVSFFQYRLFDNPYLYLEDLMANYIKVESETSLSLNYNANLK